jgi:hypothetical protein
MKYENGKVYKLTCDDLTYFGSTTQKYLSSRLAQHTQRYKSNNNSYYTAFELFKTGQPIIITLVENVNCSTKDELLARERWYIENNECVNKCIPGRSVSEWIENNKDDYLKKKREYYQNNKQHCSEKVKEWRTNNKDKVTERRKVQYETNKEKEKAQMKAYREAHKEEISLKRSQKVLCDCGREISLRNISTHKKTHSKNK